MTLDNVDLVGGCIETESIDMIVVKSSLTNYCLHFQAESFKIPRNAEENRKIVQRKQMRNRQLNITNSNLLGKGPVSSLSVVASHGDVFCDHVIVSGTHQQISVFNITGNGDVFLRNFNFTENYVVYANAAVLAIQHANVTITDCMFSNNYGQDGGVIYACVSAEVKIQACLFKDNSATNTGGAIHTYGQVAFIIENSSFINNQAHIAGGAIFSAKGATFNINSSLFNRNAAIIANGGSIATDNENDFSILNCEFTENLAGTDGSAIFLDQNNNLSLASSAFKNNTGVFKSAVLSLQYESATHIESCTFFEEISAFLQSIISCQGNATINILNSIFERSFGVFRHKSSSAATNNVFVNNTPTAVSSTISVKGSTKLTISNCQFHYNPTGCFIYGQDGAHIYIKDSKFSNRVQGRDSMMWMIDSFLTIVGSSFVNNTYQNNGAIFGTGTKVNVILSLFVGNRASNGAVFYFDSESYLFSERTVFKNNTADDGAVAFLENTIAIFSEIDVSDNIALGYGGVISAQSSQVMVKLSQFSNNSAACGGSFSLQKGSGLTSYDSIFENNSATKGGIVYNYGGGNVSFQNCSLVNNTGRSGGSLYINDANQVRLAQGFCSSLEGYDCMTFSADTNAIQKHTIVLYTYNYTLSQGNTVLSSSNDADFLLDSTHLNIIVSPASGMSWLETRFASCE